MLLEIKYISWIAHERTPICLDIFRKIEKPITTFSNVDFTNCQCHLILITVYTQMLEHCQGIGELIKFIKNIINILLLNKFFYYFLKFITIF